MPMRHISLLLLILFAFGTGNLPPAMAASTEQQAYLDAQNDVLSFMNWYTSAAPPKLYGLPTTPAAQNRVVGNLKTITGYGDGNIWKSINGTNKILVSNVSAFQGYVMSTYNDTSTDQLNSRPKSGVWVTLAPELTNLLQSTFPSGNDPGSHGVWLRTIQGIGLSPEGTYNRIVEFFIDPAQTSNKLFRPAMNTAVDQQVTTADVADAAGWTFVSGSVQEWIRDHPGQDIAGPVKDGWPNPWTGLGYTYDWNPANATHQGLTEFIAPGSNTSATVSGVASIGSYLYAQRDSAGDYADELNGNFKIWGTADTVWGKRDFFRKLYYTGHNSHSFIDLTPTGRIENGVLIEDASYTVRNAGLITALENRSVAVTAKDGGKTSNVFFINHTTYSYGSSATDLAVNVENSGTIGHDGLGAAYTFESANASSQNTNINISNTGAIYAGTKGLVLTGAGGPPSLEAVTIDNYGVLYSGTGSAASVMEGGANIKLTQQSGSVYVSRGALAINGDVDFQAGSVFLVDLTLNDRPLLTVGQTVTVAKDTVIEGHMNGGPDNAAPQSLQLISANSLSSTANRASILQGVTLLHNYELTASNGLLSAGYDHSTAAPQAKALSEGFLGGVALVNQGADTVAGQGLAEAVSSAQVAAHGNENEGQGSGLASFGVLSGGYSRYETGSHVDMHSFSLLTGLSAELDTAPGQLTAGAFVELGYGDYDTYNSFSHLAPVAGGGQTRYVGGGLLGKLDFADTGPGHFYVEASGRLGGVRNDYSSGDLRDLAGRQAGFDTNAVYGGLHAGAGYIWNIDGRGSLDIYGKYFWTRQNGDSVTLPTGDPVTFAGVDSQRLRGGARFTYAVSEQVSPYIGAAYEHEFDGRSEATTYGYAIEAPDLRGGTGLGELGLSLKPSSTAPLTLDMGVQGYTGHREGLTGSLKLKIEF